MSDSTPILTTPSEICPCAAPAPSAAAIARKIMLRLKLFMLSPSSWVNARLSARECRAFAAANPRSHAEILVQLRHVGVELRVGDHVDDAAVFHHVMPVSDGRGEVEILFDQQDRETPRLELCDGTADLLHDDGSQPFGRLVEEQ